MSRRNLRWYNGDTLKAPMEIDRRSDYKSEILSWTEDDCDGAGKYSEERWNYAFWRQDEYPIIDIEIKNKYTDVLYDWYAENGITNIGVEDTDNEYDDEMNYIGKGPAGHYELLQIAANVGMHLQKEGVIKKAWNILTQTASIA